MESAAGEAAGRDAGVGTGEPGRSARRAVFLDRDGTIMEDTGYVGEPGAVRLIPGAADALRRLRDAGYALVVVTNQSGIARGFYTEEDYRAVQARLAALLAEGGASVDAAYHCPHHPDVTGPCDCRKPGLGLYTRAARDLGLDLGRSAFVGDKRIDVEPARAFAATAILVRTGQGNEEAARGVGPDTRVVPDLGAAADALLDGDAGH